MRLAKFVAPYKWTVLSVFILTLVTALVSVAYPWLIRLLIESFSTEPIFGDLTVPIISLSLFGLLAVGGIFKYLSYWLAHDAAWWVCHDLRLAIYNHVQHLPLSFVSNHNTVELNQRISKDVENIEPIIADIFSDVLVNALVFVGVAAVMFTIDYRIALLAFVPVPLLYYITRILGKSIYNGLKEEMRLGDEMNARIVTNLSALKEIQIFNREQSEYKRISEISSRYASIQVETRRLDALYEPAVSILSGIGSVVAVFVGGRAVLSGSISTADLIAILLYLGLFYKPIMMVADVNEFTQRSAVSAGRILELLDTRNDLTDGDHELNKLKVRGGLVLENVTFSYRTDEPVLKSVHLEVRPGETLALVGPTGAGKSTIANLIPRFYDPEEGRVLIDGIDTRQYKIKDLRSVISMVSQDIFLFEGTIRENLQFGNENATFDDIVAATKIANAYNFITRFPDKFDTDIGERGVKLSGGQKQRLSIARAVLKDTPILILDEATSSVDNETEAGIQRAMAELMHNRTSVVIAHRLSTIRNADIIAVIDEGSVVEAGSHDELLKRNGLYSRLYEYQLTKEQSYGAATEMVQGARGLNS